MLRVCWCAVITLTIVAGCKKNGPGGSFADAGTPSVESSTATASSAPTASASQSARPVRLERGHAPFFEAVARLVKNPKAVQPKVEDAQVSANVVYTRYVYGDAPLGIPINNLELWVRKSDPAAWMVIVRPADDPGLFVDDFAPPGGTHTLSAEKQDIGSGVMGWEITSGPLKGSIVLLRMDKTFAVESHAEAYPRR
jgi:hypothetical protein